MSHPWNFRDLTGKRFGRLLVKGYAGQDNHKRSLWACHCKCGNEIVTGGYNLTSGHTTSCGCARATHNHCPRSDRTPTYHTWQDMLQRCNNPNSTGYKNYGGRGIKVCTRWSQFESFLADMGERPRGTTIERINRNGDYEPANCRWATKREQQNNTSRTIFITFKDETKPLSEWAAILGIDRRLLYKRPSTKRGK